jgi:hypothetical protein
MADGASRARDPYYVVRDEIATHVADVRARLTSSASSGPSAASAASAVVEECASLSWELDELDRAVAVAERDVARFGLTAGEIQERKRWSASTRAKVEDARAVAESRMGANAGRGEGGGAAFVGDGRAGGDIGRNESGLDDHQQLLVRRQDEDLDDISVSISRIGQVGLTIGDELAAQSKMLEDLEEDVDGVNARLAAAERKMREVLKKVGLRGQICVIIFLTIILFILFAIAFQ